jgi:hypothetical protein
VARASNLPTPTLQKASLASTPKYQRLTSLAHYPTTLQPGHNPVKSDSSGN